jgi:signal peptidase II
VSEPATNSAVSASLPAWQSRRAWVVLVVTTLLAIVSDLASKELAFRYVADVPVTVSRADVLAVSERDPRRISSELIPAHEPRAAVPGLLHFTLVLNPGAVFGTGPGMRWFFVGFTVVALGFGVFMFARWCSTRDHWAHVGIGLLIGGGIGNLYDRLAFACVRDFLHPLPGWKWPGGFTFRGTPEIWPYVSNVADALLLIGIGILLVFLWRKDRVPTTANAG